MEKGCKACGFLGAADSLLCLNCGHETKPGEETTESERLYM